MEELVRQIAQTLGVTSVEAWRIAIEGTKIEGVLIGVYAVLTALTMALSATVAYRNSNHEDRAVAAALFGLLGAVCGVIFYGVLIYEVGIRLFAPEFHAILRILG